MRKPERPWVQWCIFGYDTIGMIHTEIIAKDVKRMRIPAKDWAKILNKGHLQ